MNLYDASELERINKKRENNDRMEEFFDNERLKWEKRTEPLFRILTIRLTDADAVAKVMDSQAEALVARQDISQQISLFLNRRGKETIKVKKVRQDKFVFYATGFGIKTNLSEKSILIDGHLSEDERAVELIESYVDYLRDTSKNLESLSYSIKGMIDLTNYLGKIVH
jgi:hypothetical protein